MCPYIQYNPRLEKRRMQFSSLKPYEGEERVVITEVITETDKTRHTKTSGGRLIYRQRITVEISRREAVLHTTTQPQNTERQTHSLVSIGVVYLGQFLDGFVGASVAPVYDVNAVGVGVRDVFLHEASESGEIGGDAGDSHHSALRYC